RIRPGCRAIHHRRPAGHPIHRRRNAGRCRVGAVNHGQGGRSFMTIDPRELARDLLARSAGGHTAAPVAGRPAPVGPARTRPRACPMSSFVATPDVVRVREVYGGPDDLYRAAELTTPLFEPHWGSNGASVHQGGRRLINFSSFSYLNLASHPRVH